MGKNKSIVIEMWNFLKKRKVWWITPIIILFLIVGTLIILSSNSSVYPFIYVLF
jgi:hypothetical protein